jgi:glycosyltransferase involved in cell wall biosynthesis
MKKDFYDSSLKNHCRLRALFVNDYYFATGGASIANRNLCDILRQKGADIAVITCAGKDAEYQEDKHSFYVIPAMVSHGSVQIGMPLISYIKSILVEFKPEIVHLQVPSIVSFVTLLQAKKLGIPVVAGIHDLPENISTYSPIMKSAVTRMAKFLLTKWFGQADTAIAPSQYAKSYYQSLGVKAHIEVISNGVNRSLFQYNEAAAKRFIDKYTPDSNQEGLRVIYAGRISPEKNLEVLIKALEGVDATTVFVGPVESHRYLGRLKQLINGNHDKVIFTGAVSVDELIGAYSASDLLVQPSTCELQSLVILEAMSCSTPVIAADHGPIPELVIDGKNGLLFRPFDSIDLRTKIEQISAARKDQRNEMSRESLKSVAGHSLDCTAERYLGLYEQLISSKHGSWPLLS